MSRAWIDVPPATPATCREGPRSVPDSQASGAPGRDAIWRCLPYWSGHSAEEWLSCHATAYRGRPCVSCRLMASRSLCHRHRTQSPRARIVTRFTIPGSCDRPPARCESAWLQRRGRSVDERLNGSHSILSTQGPDMRKACWAIPPHMRRNASRIQFHSRRERVISESFGNSLAPSCGTPC